MKFYCAAAVLASTWVLLSCGTGTCSGSADTDPTIILQDRANGSAAVLLAVAAIQQSGVFGNDNDILRRIAYVETRDGTTADTFRSGYNGGIWAVDESTFANTKNIDGFARLPAKLQQIEETLSINWFNVQWSDLRRPLYSALAARLVIFQATRPVPPASDILGQAEFWVEHYNSAGNTANFVTTSTGLEGSILENSANEFVVGFSYNLEGTSISLFVSTPEPTPVRFTVTANGLNFEGVATSDSSTEVTIPPTLEVRSGTERNKGILVRAEGERKIVVYGLSYAEFTTDAYLALPCSTLAVDEYEYFAVTYPSTRWNSDILIVGCEDNTVVTTPLGTVPLNRLETYYLSQGTDTTGMRVTSNKPVSFFSNQVCTNIPAGTEACDHLTEQIPPTSTWGTSFFAASLLGRSSGEIFRIVASRSSTTVTVNCTTYVEAITYNLNLAGNWIEYMTFPLSFCNIEASAPVLVTQFGLGNGFDNIGDPLMMMIPPVQQYSNSYVLSVLPEFSTNYITLYVATEFYQPERVFVDSINQANSIWTPVYCTDSRLCGYITRVSLAAGEHRVYHQNPNGRVGVSAYGFNTFNSYGYPGGLKLTPIQLSTVSFADEDYSVSEGAGTLTVNVTRSGSTETSATVLVATDNFQGTASVKEDYISIAEIITFAPGETLRQIEVRINNDMRIERNESFQLYLTAGAGVHLSPFPRTEIIIENDDGMITLEPSYGNILGGTGVVVSGDSLDISATDDITCLFDGVWTNGVYIAQTKVLCVSPKLTRTGRVNFQLQVTGTKLFSGEATFTSLSYMKSYDVYVGNDNLLFAEGDMIKVRWSPVSLLPMESPDTYTVDIDLIEMNANTGDSKEPVSLATDVPNNGVKDVRMPAINTVDGNVWENSASPAVVRVSVSNRTLNQVSRKRVVGLVGRLAYKLARYAAVRYVRKLARQLIQRATCELWAATEPPSIGQDILARLPPCPTRIRDIRLPTSGFKEERLSSLSPVIGEIQTTIGHLELPVVGTVGTHVGYTVIDDKFREFFHPGTTSCFRQRVTTPALTRGSGQQCCYNGDNLVTGSPGGGTVDLYSPDVDLPHHILYDVLPFLLCCKAGRFSNCDLYYKHRPSDRGVDFSPPPPPAIFRGDPHLVTLDGHQYTFNGNGEFTLIDTPDKSFALQARMVPINSTAGNSSQATVFKAIVARQNNSDTVQFEITEDGAIALVNGEQLDFSLIKEYEFNNVIVNDLGNNSFSATFYSGVYLEVKEENDIFSLLIVSLPAAFMGVGTRGLMGSFNGNKSDDLLPNFGQVPLSLNSTTQEIHAQFGITWIIDTPSDSLFTYQPGENWGTFHDPYFVPIYTAIFADPELELQANDLCGTDQQCLFDIAATGILELGQSTLVRGREFEEIMELQIPVVCSTPCTFGACVANDTCYCAAGYEGRYCTEQVISECEENPCQNGGSCQRHVLDHNCTCPSTHTGNFCETEIETPSTMTQLIGIVIGIVGGLLLIAIVSLIVLAVWKIQSKRSKGKLNTTYQIREETEMWSDRSREKH